MYPSELTCATSPGFISPPGNLKYGLVVSPPVALLTSTSVVRSSETTRSADILVNCGCDVPWLPISKPSLAMRLTTSELAATLARRKQVARAPFCSRTSRSRLVDEAPRSQSNVSAAHGRDLLPYTRLPQCQAPAIAFLS